MRLAIGVVVALLLMTATAWPRNSGPARRTTPGIPTIKSVLGHDFGEEVSAPEEIAIYLRALAAAAPDRTRLVEYARTWEGRPAARAGHRLARPHQPARPDQGRPQAAGRPAHAVSGADESRLLGELPVVTWLMHAVHGNEISSSDAALAEAYHLLAARGDAMVDTILRESIVLIDPLENPDGRSRFLFQNKLGRAATPGRRAR